MPDKTPKSKQIMDVSHPGTRGSQPSSRPIIVTNRPVLKDPMMTADSPANDTQTPPVKADGDATPKPTKIKIEPIHDDVKPEEDTTSTSQLIGAPKLPVEDLEDDETSEPEVPETPDAPESDEAPDKTKTDTAQPEAATKEAEPAKKADQTPAAAANTDEPQPESDEKAGDEPVDKVADSLPDAPETTENDAKAAKAADQADTQLADLGKPDAKATKEAKEAAERQLALDKLVADETYFLPVDRAGKRRVHRVVLIVLLLLVVAALVAVDLLLDAGIITLGGVQPLTDFIYAP